MKRKIAAIALVTCMALGMAGCSSYDRMKVDFKSDIAGGLNRTINVYTADGKIK
jgi:hypothetical protein